MDANEVALRVLIVEDEVATAWALAERLTEEGYSAVAVHSAEQALKHLRRQGCDLVIADLRLPGMGGVELIRRLARRKKPVPAIAITGLGTPRLVGQVIGAGALQCFLKPFQVELLIEGVRQALDTEAA
jgi:DNA-binding NtrC family response regulator